MVERVNDAKFNLFFYDKFQKSFLDVIGCWCNVFRVNEKYIFVKNKKLKKYLVQYKPFLIFLLKFFLSYAILTFLYQIYLNKYDTTQFEVDALTKIVARQAQQTTTFFGYHS